MSTSLPLPLRLHFIRHGETEWSLSGQHSGRADISLAAHGEDEARAVGKRLRDIPFAHVLTSPLQRAQQTSALADSRIGVARLDVPEHLPPGAPADGEGPKAGGQE